MATILIAIVVYSQACEYTTMHFTLGDAFNVLGDAPNAFNALGDAFYSFVYYY